MLLSELLTTTKDVQQMDSRNQEGFNVFVCMNPLKHGCRERTKANLAAIRNVYCEVDRDGDSVLQTITTSAKVPAPTLILESSPHKYQFIWRVEEFSITQQESLNKTLAREFWCLTWRNKCGTLTLKQR
jgi:hypothetical protein